MTNCIQAKSVHNYAGILRNVLSVNVIQFWAFGDLFRRRLMLELRFNF